MPCAMCGKEGPVDDKGLCGACSAKLGELSDLSALMPGGAASSDEIDVVSDSGELDTEAAVQDDAKAAGARSRVLFEMGQSDACTLRNPFSVALDPAGNILVMDRPARRMYRVAMFSPDGEFRRAVVECEQGNGPGQLKQPKGIAIDGNGNIYVPDAGNDRIQRFDGQGQPMGAIGRAGDGPAEFHYPCDVEIDDMGSVYVADTYNCRIQKLTPQGSLLLVIGEADDASEPLLDEPVGVTVDGEGNVYVADTNHHRMITFDAQGQQRLAFGHEGIGPGEFTYPSDIRVDDDGLMYVADNDNLRVQKFDPTGAFLVEFALGEATGSRTGGDVAIDDDGCLLICNEVTHTVAKVELLDLSRPPSGGAG